jgi:ubiquitin carboxyl-terminal hydrolase 8
MNAVVQCLSATTPLTRYFLDGSFQGALQPGNTFGSKGELPGVYANLVRQLWSGNYIYITPKTIRVC